MSAGSETARNVTQTNPPMTDDQSVSAPILRAAELTPLVTRGVCRLLRAMGYGTLTEFPLRNGRRADALGIAANGHVVAVEVKTSIADYRGDAKWPHYRDFCDAFYFAVSPQFPRDIIPEECGLIVADHYDAAMIRDAAAHPLHPSRRKALVLQFALLAGGRLHRLTDPGP